MIKTNYYRTYKDDFIETQDVNYKLPEDYIWIHNNVIYKVVSKILYYIAYLFSFFYCKLFLNIKIENKEILKKYKKQGYFLYGNHTMPLADVLNPARIVRPKRIYVIANSTNLKVKGIGAFLPMLGILPIPYKINKMKDFLKAVSIRSKEKNVIVIYPEAHVWPYYTKIRPFEETSFKFPVQEKLPAFCMTTTFYKKKDKERPGIKVYIDGPFFIDEKLTPKENQKKLHDEIYDKMVKRSKLSNYEYIKYEKISE